MAVTYEALEQSFSGVIERNRKGLTVTPCDGEALSAHAFFYLDENEPDDFTLITSGLPFESFWVITSFKGIAVCAIIEPMPGFPHLPRPDYAWYPASISGEPIRTNEREIDEKAACIIDRALNALQRNHLREVDSPVQATINRGREKTVGKPSFVPAIPPFIRITRDLPEQTGDGTGTHASPVPHDRRGHWRTYRSSGKRVWVNDCKVRGGATDPQTYRVLA